MDVFDAIRGRRSVRRFEERELPPEKLELLKEALVWAPSAGNLQKRRFFFVFREEVKTELSEAALGQAFIGRAPLVVVACADLSIAEYYGDRGLELYCIQDVACSLENLMLAAYSLGLGSVWVGAFDGEKVSSVLGLPANLAPTAIVPVGYAAGVPGAPSRVAVDTAVKEIR